MVAPFPTIFWQGATGGKIPQSSTGSRRWHACRPEIELGDLLAFFLRRDQRRAAVELVHDVEEAVLEVFRSGARCKQSTDPNMRHGTFAFGDKRVRRLLDPVVEEGVRVA